MLMLLLILIVIAAVAGGGYYMNRRGYNGTTADPNYPTYGPGGTVTPLGPTARPTIVRSTGASYGGVPRNTMMIIVVVVLAILLLGGLGYYGGYGDHRHTSGTHSTL